MERRAAVVIDVLALVAAVDILFTFVGPGRIWIVARVDIDDALRGAQVEALVRGIESGLKRRAEEVYRVDVVPIGGAQDTGVPPRPRSTA